MRFINLVARRSLLLGLLSACVLGCGQSDGLNRRPVKGLIADAEDRKGTLTLRPLGKTEGPSVTTAIVDGSFTFNAQDGPVPGNYDAIIRLQIEDAGDSKSGKPGAKPGESGGKDAPAGSAPPPDHSNSTSVPAPVYEPDRIVKVKISEDEPEDLDL